MKKKRKASNFFEEILSIPRSSGNEGNISQYLGKFAETYGLEYEIDDTFNVIIKKPGNIPGNNEPIILQAHTDMVCTSTIEYDFLNQGIDWTLEHGYYKAKNTSLGGDDGAGVAIILAILADDELVHPPIEAIFTTQEETTMNGAKNLNYKHIHGKRLISLDGTEEGTIEVSCAGMASFEVWTSFQLESSKGSTFELSISGLMGGHSGVDIDKNRGNAIKILAHILSEIEDIEIVSISGGTKENVIPSDAKCIFHSCKDFSSKFEFLKKYYLVQYSGIKIHLKRLDSISMAMNNEISRSIITYLNLIEDGVLVKNDVDSPITSSNLGVIRTNSDKVIISQSIRSSLVGYEDFYLGRAEGVAKECHLKFKQGDKKPFFTYKEDSPLRKLLVNKYQELFHKNVTLEHVHAGLEGGIFAYEIKDLDICVIGVNLYDIHSVNETVEKKSLDRVFLWLSEALKCMK